ncbi:MAG: TVP38/TMEM64 family protein [Clostridia bacterium]|nr:TVP38/TMEM64 family protein [Clostridia bacterium]
MNEHETHLSPKAKKIITIVSLVIFVLFFAAIAWFVGRPMLKFVKEPEQFRAWVDGHGIVGQLAFIGMQVLQVVVAVIPGEPLELGAGYAFGVFGGLALCLIGVFIGGAIIFALTRWLGMKALEAFFPREKIESLKFLQNEKRLELIAFILFFIPGTPKDLLTYFGGLTPIKWYKWLLITTFARVPSIITSVIAGNALGQKDYTLAIVITAATLVISAAGLVVYGVITKKRRDKAKAEEAAAEAEAEADEEE